MAKKTIHIFYSWMSDWDEYKTNRLVIKACLNRAIKRVEKAHPEYELYLDEATRGESGTVHIPLTIENKIREADIFVGDISIINPKSTYRKTSNPNVLYELALASELVDWPNIICVFNQHYGGFKDLPFDIGFRRPITYTLRQKMLIEDKPKAKEIKEILTRDFEIALKTIFENGIVTNKIRTRELKKTLNNSNWIAYNQGAEQTLQNKKGEVSIKHQHGNLFLFDFKSFEDGGVRFENGDWKADIFLNRDSLKTARLNFESNGDFGFKELIITEDRLYLLGVNLQNEGYGKQILVRTNQTSEKGPDKRLLLI
jgi:hypothetical protein